MTHHDGFAPVIDVSSMHHSTPSTIRPHTSDRYICTHCDTSHDDSAHPAGVTTHNVMVDDSNTYDGTFTSPIVLEDSSTYGTSVTHSLVVPFVSDQYVITEPTSYSLHDPEISVLLKFQFAFGIWCLSVIFSWILVQFLRGGGGAGVWLGGYFI